MTMKQSISFKGNIKVIAMAMDNVKEIYLSNFLILLLFLKEGFIQTSAVNRITVC